MIYGKGDDEEEFTGPHSKRRDQHSCAIGKAIAVHFSYSSQDAGLMEHTDLLRRYDRLSRQLLGGDKGRGHSQRVKSG